MASDGSDSRISYHCEQSGSAISKHDEACQRRRDDQASSLCTCGLSDEQVANALGRRL